jgi:putative ABC transport system permease protein
MRPSPKKSLSAGVWIKIALRELSGGVGGFWIYFACLALGAWAISASGSVTETFSRGLSEQSRTLLGGDAQLGFSQREASQAELDWMAARGRVSQMADVDMMARSGDVVRQADVRGIDGAYPLLGRVSLAPDVALSQVVGSAGGMRGLAVSQSFLDALGLSVGDTVELGGNSFQIRAVILSQPDRLGVPGAFQPSVLMAIEALREVGELDPGRLFRTSYRLLLEPSFSRDIEAEIETDWPDVGIRYRGPDDAVDGLRDLLDMLDTFMTVIGIAALVAGGVGVAQATVSFLESRVDSIAALKALGADAGHIRAAYALQLGALAMLGSGVGTLAGAASPWVLTALAGDRIPLPSSLGVFPLPLAKGFVLGVLAAIVFAAPALGRARSTPPARLFRRAGEGLSGAVPAQELFVSASAAAVLTLLAVLGSVRPLVTLSLLAGAAAVYLIMAGAAQLIRRLSSHLAGRSRGFMRLVLANLGGPGSLAPTLTPALGLGLSLLTLVAVVQTNLLGQIRDTAPANAPALIIRQVPHEDVAAFDNLMASQGVDVENARVYQRAPFILGRVTTIDGETLQEEAVAREERWVVRGETAMSFMAAPPQDLRLKAGAWWKEDYSGPLLVSVEEGVAQGLSLSVGDRIGFRIFGRDLEAKVASIRKVDWGGFGANMAFILSPGVLEAARPFHTAIVRLDPSRETEVMTAIADRWPGVLVFQLRRTLETAADLFDEVALIVTVLASVVTLAGVLVLFGAFAAAARRRRQDSALLKTFGASRVAILGLYAVEFALAGSVAVALGAGLGVAASHPIVINVFEAQWRFAWGPVLLVSSISVVSAALGGLAVGWATLSHRPAHVLRSA